MKHFKIFIFSAFALVSAVTLRTIQLLFLTDSKTGFYKQGMEGVGTALMVLVIAVIAAASTLVFLFKKESLSPAPTSSALLGCAALFAGIANKEDSKKDATKKFISWIYQMNKDMNIPLSIKEIKEEDLKELSIYADKEGNPLYPVPKLMDKEKLKQMFIKVKNKE